MAAIASAESQGKTIALVIFVLLTIVGGVLSFYFYDQVDTAIQERDGANQAAQKARGEMLAAKKNFEELLPKILPVDKEKGEILAGGSKEDTQKILQMIDGLLTTPDVGARDKKKYESFNDALTFLHNALKEADATIAQKQAGIDERDKKIASLQGSYEDNVAAREKDKEDKAAELLAVTKQFQDETNSIKGELTDERNRRSGLQNEIQEVRQNAEIQKASSERTIKNLTVQLQKERENKDLAKMVNFVKANGTITNVSRQKDNTLVTINLGSDDSLYKQTTFGVYGRDEGGTPYVLPKASIEVVKILDGHRAEARLYGETIQDPVLPGDLLYHPIWEKDQRLGIAILGQIHMDNDNLPDNEEFMRIVNDLGAQVDSYYDATEGKQKGTIDFETAWLLLGEAPELGANATEEEKKTFGDYQKAALAMRRQAYENGVPVINARNFLTFMGHQQPQRTVRSGEEPKYMFGKGRPRLIDKGPIPANSTDR